MFSIDVTRHLYAHLHAPSVLTASHNLRVMIGEKFPHDLRRIAIVQYENQRATTQFRPNPKKYLYRPLPPQYFRHGEMAEWSIAAVLKTVEVKASGGSNPSLSAQKLDPNDCWDFFCH